MRIIKAVILLGVVIAIAVGGGCISAPTTPASERAGVRKSVREGSISREQIRSGTRDAPVGSGAPGRRVPRSILPCGTAQQGCRRRAGLPARCGSSLQRNDAGVEPAILSDAISSFYPTSADGLQPGITATHRAAVGPRDREIASSACASEDQRARRPTGGLILTREPDRLLAF
jgi:hypothetical protein